MAKIQRVLVVDDEEYIRGELASIIESGEREILQASNGLEAIAILEQVRVDLVLTDIRMPEMDGFELLRLARSRWPGLPIKPGPMLIHCGIENWVIKKPDLAVSNGQKPIGYERVWLISMSGMTDGMLPEQHPARYNLPAVLCKYF